MLTTKFAMNTMNISLRQSRKFLTRTQSCFIFQMVQPIYLYINITILCIICIINESKALCELHPLREQHEPGIQIRLPRS